MFTWPPNSPDLNPIEHLWDDLGKLVWYMEVLPRNLQDLKDLQIPQHTFRVLVESMPWWDRIKWDSDCPNTVPTETCLPRCISDQTVVLDKPTERRSIACQGEVFITLMLGGQPRSKLSTLFPWCWTFHMKILNTLSSPSCCCCSHTPWRRFKR